MLVHNSTLTDIIKKIRYLTYATQQMGKTINEEHNYDTKGHLFHAI